jgi:uncharacterized protein YhbP (UPF0306 family)
MESITNAEKARRIISQNNYMTLATSDKNGTPWSAPLYYAFDDKYNFFFISANDALHINHININAHVAISIFDSHAPVGEGDGVQIEALATSASLLELPHILSVYFRRRFPDEMERIKHHHLPTEYMGKNLFWFFKVTPTKVYTLDLTVTKVDKRIEVNLREE